MPKPFLTAVALGSAIAAMAHANTQEPIKTHAKPVSIGVVKGLDLSSFQKGGLREFRSMKAYFGALYVSEDGTSYQHFVNWHDLNKVKVAARKGCEIISKGNPCTLAAVSVPRGVDPNGTEVTGLGSWAVQDLATYRAEQVPGGYGAFAISGSAHQGYAHNWPNEAEARATALAFCKAAVARDYATLGIEGRAFARAKGYDTCRVIDVTGPDH